MVAALTAASEEVEWTHTDDAATLGDAAASLRVLKGQLYPGGWRARRCKKRLGPSRKNLNVDADAPDSSHPLFGRRVVVARLASITKADAMIAIMKVGGIPVTKPSRLTDFVVVSPDDVALLGTSGCPKMLREVAAIREQGCSVQYLSEQQFVEWIAGSEAPG